MIRINLLAVERRRRARGLELVQKLTVACSAILVAALLGIGWWYWSLRQGFARLDQEIAAAQQETLRLRSVLDQVQKFELRRTQLQQRVALIEQLRAGQSGPVRLLDEISRALPDRLWLTEVNQDGADVTIQGRSTSLTALSDFVANLEASGYFRRPVEILESQVEEQAQAQVQVQTVRFSVRAQFAMPGP